MWELYWLVLVSHLAVAANAYHIISARTTWKEANDLCQRNGSTLAVLDSQQKADELSRQLTSLGYRHGFQTFWIGLVFNASAGQFLWSSGDTAQEAFVNSTCGLNPNTNNNVDWCYLFKNNKANSSCFEKRPCWSNLHSYICQSVSSKDKNSTEIPSFNLETSTVTRNAESSVLMTIPKTSSSSITSRLDETPTATPSLELKTTTSPSGIASRVFNIQPVKTVSTSSSSNTDVKQQSSILLDKTPTTTLPLGIKTSTSSRNIMSSIVDVQSAMTTSTTSSSSLDTEVKNEIHSNNPVLEFISAVASLDPEDPQSLELVTDAYQDFATSMTLSTNKESEDNIIDSARVIEDFAFKYASFNLNSSRNQEIRQNQHIVIQVTLVSKGYTQNFTFTKEDGEDEVARITLPSYLFQNQDTVVVNVLYSDLHKYVDNVNPRNSQIDSTILGSSVKPSQHNVFTENVTIVLRTFEENRISARKSCVFWKWNDSHPANGSWSGEGCSQVESNRSHVVCTCNHLTNFAILMNIKRYKIPKEHRKPLSFLTYIGLGISLLGETITIIAYMLLLCSRHDQQSHVHVNLVATLAIAQMIFLAGIDATRDQVLCLTAAASIHYLYLSSFCWMLIEGVMLYLLIIEVYNTELKLPFCYLFSFGFPGLVVGGTLLIAHLTGDGISQYRAEKWCWLSTENFYIWSFAAPVILIATVNVIVFCGVVREMVSMPSTQSTKLNAVKTTVKACIVLFPLLGVTWLFGLLSIANAGVVPQYIFTVLNSLQGFLIFLLHCVRNTEVRSAWNKKLRNLKKRAWRFFKIRSPPSSSTSEAQSYKPEKSEMELGRKSNKIAPVEG